MRRAGAARASATRARHGRGRAAGLVRAFVLALVLALGLAVLGAGIAIERSGWRPPPAWNPWAPLEPDAEPNRLTDWKLRRTAADPAACHAAVAALGWRLAALPDRETGPGCGFRDAYRLEASGLQIGAPLTLSCPMLLSLAMWERHTLQPAARRHLGQPLQRLQHAGSYACRNLYHRGDGPRSRHATADALDITGFTAAGGRHVSVRRDWPGDTPAAAFLHEAHEGACRWFDGALGPAYNAAHADHFHLEAGGWRVCR